VRPLESAGEILSAEELARVQEDAELLEHGVEAFSTEEFLAGRMTPVFYGSALNNFGVEPFLRSFLKLAPAPRPRESSAGLLPPTSTKFAGVIFKIQANLDPRHHDRVAFLRVCAGRFTRDMEITHARTGETIRIKRSQSLFARERETVEHAYAGDVLGLVIPGQFRLGDTLCEGEKLEILGQWNFSPECFGVLRCTDTQRRKQFDRGLQQLAEEGAIQLLTEPGGMSQETILAAVGPLQFDVVQFRLESEYKAKTTLTRLSYQHCRWVTGAPADLEAMRTPTTCRQLADSDGNVILLFDSLGMLRYCMELNPKLTFSETRPN
jgi:peptide chain release factor 3